MDDRPLLPKGHIPILSPVFKYVPAADTDVAKTFERIKRQLEEEHGRLPPVVALTARKPA